MVKKISIALSIVLAVVLALLVWHETQIESTTAALYQEMSVETNALSSEIKDLQQQIDELETEASAILAGTATAQFLATDLSTECYQTVLSPLAAYGYPIGLALSLTELPGAEGCLTLEEAQGLVSQGWYYCYAYDEAEAAALLDGQTTAETLTDEEASEALSLWLSAVTAAAEERELTLSGVVYFPSGTFRESFAETLKAQGIQTVLHNGELGAGLLTASEEDGLWYAGVVWWRGNEILASKLYTIASRGGELVTLVGIPDTSTKLESWMQQFEERISSYNIAVTDFTGMIETQTANASIAADAAAEQEAQIAELEAQIEELNAQIEDLENNYVEQVRSLGK